EEVNECWLADRDRFSYEALNSEERLALPMIKQGGEWKTVDWQTALEYVANGLKQIKDQHGAQSIGALVSPHSTLEELFLTGQLLRGIGSDNIDWRLRNAQFNAAEGVRWLGTSIASLSELQAALVVGSNLRKDHPLFAQRIRQAIKKGAQVFALNAQVYDWAMPVTASVVAAQDWAQALADIAAAVAQAKGVAAPVAAQSNPEAEAIAQALLSGERKAVLLGNAAAHHAQADELLALANWIGEHTGATVGYLTEAANTVGAQWVKAQPQSNGLNAAQMMAGGLKAAILLNNEPAFDSAAGQQALQGLNKSEMVVTLSPFKANMEISDVLLPIAPFTETSGTFVNAEGRVQSFHAVVKPQGEARPAWKVLRVLANLLGVQGADYDSSQDVLATAIGAGTTAVPAQALSNATKVAAQVTGGVAAEPAVASIYQLDSIVRRATSLQLTADARLARQGGAA
ncbi:MAG: molybdopterin-dependent oxidoreductase, partial [Comamonadaceae bacterium]|nr:molybdopterin-dependent oxidoreductase [Comamonadaceae bacterium]